MKNQALTIFAFILLGLFAQKSVFADTTNFLISPSVVKITAKPGSSPLVDFSIENKGDPVLIKLQLIPFTPLDNLGHIQLEKSITEPISFSIKELPSAFKEPFLMKSNTQQHLTLTLTLPSDLEEKDYYLSILAQTTPFPAEEGETTLSFSDQIGANILLTVTSNGRIEQKAAIPLFAVPPSTLFKKAVYDSSNKIPAILIIKNNGRNIIKPTVTVEVKGIIGGKKYSLPSQNILTNSQRLMIDSKNCDQSCGDAYSLYLKGFYIGNYSVTATVSSGSGSSVVATTSFTAVPFKLIGGLVIIFFISLFLRLKLTKER